MRACHLGCEAVGSDANGSPRCVRLAPAASVLARQEAAAARRKAFLLTESLVLGRSSMRGHGCSCHHCRHSARDRPRRASGRGIARGRVALPSLHGKGRRWNLQSAMRTAAARAAVCAWPARRDRRPRALAGCNSRRIRRRCAPAPTRCSIPPQRTDGQRNRALTRRTDPATRSRRTTGLTCTRSRLRLRVRGRAFEHGRDRRSPRPKRRSRPARAEGGWRRASQVRAECADPSQH